MAVHLFKGVAYILASHLTSTDSNNIGLYQLGSVGVVHGFRSNTIRALVRLTGTLSPVASYILSIVGLLTL